MKIIAILSTIVLLTFYVTADAVEIEIDDVLRSTSQHTLYQNAYAGINIKSKLYEQAIVDWAKIFITNNLYRQKLDIHTENIKLRYKTTFGFSFNQIMPFITQNNARINKLNIHEKEVLILMISDFINDFLSAAEIAEKRINKIAAETGESYQISTGLYEEELIDYLRELNKELEDKYSEIKIKNPVSVSIPYEHTIEDDYGGTSKVKGLAEGSIDVHGIERRELYKQAGSLLVEISDTRMLYIYTHYMPMSHIIKKNKTIMINNKKDRNLFDDILDEPIQVNDFPGW